LGLAFAVCGIGSDAVAMGAVVSDNCLARRALPPVAGSYVVGFVYELWPYFCRLVETDQRFFAAATE
jgi:hypothetical protein